MTMSRLGWAIEGRRLLAGIAVSLTCAVAAGQGPYAVEYLGYQGSSLFMNNMNNHDQCVGDTLVNNVRRPWIAGRAQAVGMLPLPAGYVGGYAIDINDHGVVAGYVLPAGGASRAARWRPDAGGYAIDVLEMLPGHVGGRAIAINNVGDILGVSLPTSQSSGTPVVFLPEGDILNLTAAGFPVGATDINDERQICGDRYRMDIDTLALEDLGLPPPNGYQYIFVNGVAINNSGQVAARGVLSSSQGYVEIIRYTDGVGWEPLSGFISSQNWVYDINDDGSVLMNVPFASARRLVLYTDALGRVPLEYFLDDRSYYWLPTVFFNARLGDRGVVGCMVDNLNNSDPRFGVGLLTPAGAMIAPGDVDADGYVEPADLCAWQTAPTDLDGDGAVDESDRQFLIAWLFAYGFTIADCDGNGSADYCDLDTGAAQDQNRDGIPDHCQSDCNGDGMPDAGEPDCDGNGVPDPCDIAAGANPDCNRNGVPDACDAAANTTFDFHYPVPSVPIFPNTTLTRSEFVRASGMIDDLNFRVRLDFRIGDTAVRLSHAGVTVTLIDRPGYPSQYNAGFSELGFNVTLDDEGTGGPIENRGNYGGVFEPIASPPSFRPNNPLSAFDGLPLGGVWTLEVQTHNSSPIAMLYSWSIDARRAAAPVGACTGDANCDGRVDFFDIDPFVLALFDPTTYAAAHCGGAFATVDCNGDGSVNFFDIDPFLGCLFGDCP